MQSSKVGIARFGALGFLVLGLGCAAFVAFLIGNMMRGTYTGTRVTPIVVAKDELRAGMPIVASALEVRPWPEEAVPKGAFATVEALLRAHEGTIATVGILAGEPVVSSRLGTSQNGTGVAPLVHPGMRALALKVDDALGFTGLVYPGASVDVVATIRDTSAGGATSKTIVQRARVLSVGMDADVATRHKNEERLDKLTGTPANGGTYITLEVTPDDAETISVARNSGVIDIALRNGSDDKVIDTAGAAPSQFATKTSALEEVKDDAKASAHATTPAPVNTRPIELLANEGPDTPPPAPPPRQTTKRTTASHSDPAQPPTTIETYRAK